MPIEPKIVKPLLKWPGGKRWLARKIIPCLKADFKRYIEPFLGGGAFLFALLPSRGIVSDINPDLIACYGAIKADPHRVFTEFTRLGLGKAEYYRIRDHWYPRSEVKRAARLIYLLRHSWNGLYRVNRQGHFNVPYCPRKRKDRLTQKMVLEVQSVLQTTHLRCQDFSKTIQQARSGDLLFVDPPYFENGRRTFQRYSSVYFRESEQERLVSCLLNCEKRGATWIFTNGSLKQVKKLFPKYDIFAVARYSTISADPRFRKKIEEYVVFSRNSPLLGVCDDLTGIPV